MTVHLRPSKGRQSSGLGAEIRERYQKRAAAKEMEDQECELGFIAARSPKFDTTTKPKVRLNDLLLVRGIPSAGDEKPFYVGQLVKEKGELVMHYRNNLDLDPYGSYDLSVYQNGKGREVLCDRQANPPIIRRN